MPLAGPGLTGAGVNTIGPMADLGSPASYLTLQEGAPVYSSDGERLGAVEHVLADPRVDIFDGIVLDRSALPGFHRFVDAAHVAEIYERGVELRIDAAAAAELPEPSENPAAMHSGPADLVPDDLADKLRRAWHRIAGSG
jgi:hypothetical protein